MKRLPPLIVLLLRNAALGFAVAIAFVAAMLLFDVGGLGSLVSHSPDGVVATLALTFVTGLTFGSVQMGIAIMGLAEDDGAGPPGGRPPRHRRTRRPDHPVQRSMN
jgi:hypothetical protein